ncbi:aminotransferase class V-fold PLP-dependent enzyme [Candidatus Carsonella ruddii]|uniref:Putative selenocysteine lyase n=1 Tax=Candidatus Carsonella ruddii CE isolate Thao2000 TaxID=1202536 RepID=J7GS17_CARRU|nr:aminotransferase class V-fold PLP-dependent enzyme [Candidatus Carsonella ruddii]AFP83512.1 putative selenocysteine lyase [Candidatus Carsonella ruddii CE isolate Thao2000]
MKNNFPFFLYYKKIINFDNSSTNQKPKIFFKSTINCLKIKNLNLNRGDFYLINKLEIFYNKFKLLIKKILNINYLEEIIISYNSTFSINFLINNLLNFFITKNEIIVSNTEHNSIIIPLINFIKKKNCIIKIIPTFKNYINNNLLCNYYNNLTKLLIINHLSNNIGIINNIKNLSKISHFNNTIIFVDSTQSISYILKNIKKIKIDFLIFSLHKIFSATGVSVIYFNLFFNNKLSYLYYGGSSIKFLNYKEIFLKKNSLKFEIGTINLNGIFSSYYSLKWYLKNKKNIFFLNYYLKKNFFFLFKKKKKNIINIFLLNIKKNFLFIYFLEKNKILTRCDNLCNYIKNNFINKKKNCRISFSFYNNIKEILKLKFLIFFYNFKIKNY